MSCSNCIGITSRPISLGITPGLEVGGWQSNGKFQVHVDALKWVSQGENFMVIKRFSNLLEAVYVKLSKKGSKKRKARMML